MKRIGRLLMLALAGCATPLCAQSFDKLDLGTLPPIVSAARLIQSRRAPPKGELESSAEYSLRLDSLLPIDTVAAVVEPACYRTAYNADLQVLDVTFIHPPEGSPFGIPIQCSHRLGTSRTGRNAYNARFRVTQATDRLAYLSAVWFVGSGGDASIWPAPLSVEEARRSRTRLQVLVVARVFAVAPTEERHIIAATITEPLETTMTITEIHVASLALVLYDPLTRRVLATRRYCRQHCSES
jgi:hypothetical protein